MKTHNENKYQEKFLSFLKRHNLYDEEKYNYLIKKATFIDLDIDKPISSIGCYYVKNEYNVVTKIELCLPKLNDNICVMIAIHEYIHGYLMYNRLNKSYKPKASDEVLPMFYEYLYYLEEKNEELEEYRTKTIEYVEKELKIKYLLGFLFQEELLETYNHDINKMDLGVKKKSPRLIKELKISTSN